MALTFLLAPPSDTLGLVLKSPSKLNIVRFFPLTDSEVATNTLQEKVKGKWVRYGGKSPKQVMLWGEKKFMSRDLFPAYKHELT